MDLELELAEAAALPEPEAPAGPRPAWEDPRRWRLPAFGRTVWDLLFHPADFFRNLGNNGLAEPFAFGLVAGVWGYAASLFWLVLLGAAVNRAGAEGSGIFQALGIGAGMGLAAMVLAPVVVVAGMGAGSFCLWAALAAVGENRGFNAAWRLYGYLQGVALLGIIPVLGAPLAKIWGLFLLILGMQTYLEVSLWKALAALTIFLLLLALLWALLLGSLLTLTLGAGLGFLLLLGSG